MRRAACKSFKLVQLVTVVGNKQSSYGYSYGFGLPGWTILRINVLFIAKAAAFQDLPATSAAAFKAALVALFNKLQL